jgi:hypothetical protein
LTDKWKFDFSSGLLELVLVGLGVLFGTTLRRLIIINLNEKVQYTRHLMYGNHCGGVIPLMRVLHGVEFAKLTITFEI